VTTRVSSARLTREWPQGKTSVRRVASQESGGRRMASEQLVMPLILFDALLVVLRIGLRPMEQSESEGGAQ
jgi:hypothetical protein